MDTVATILVVDDHQDLLDDIGLVLELAGYQVLQALHGTAALEILQSQPVDLILADIAMPGMNGYQLYEHVRDNPAWLMIPFLFLTARSMDSDIRFGKQLGVDDYLTKPIESEDLLAAIQGKLRRSQQLASSQATWEKPDAAQTSQADPLVIGHLKIEVAQHRVWFEGQPVKLSAREFKLLLYLAQRVDQVVHPPELIQVTHEFEADTIEAGALLRPLVRSLRRKLGYKVGEMGCLENVRGVGYRLLTP